MRRTGATSRVRHGARAWDIVVATVAGLLCYLPLVTMATGDPRLAWQVARLPQGAVSATGTLVMALVVAPSLEEWVFRHVLWERLSGQARPATVAAICAVAFALCHASAALVTQALVLGALLGVVRLLRPGVWLCIAMHSGANAAPFVMSLLFPSVRHASPVWVIGCVLGVFVMLGILFQGGTAHTGNTANPRVPC
jgi:membrane protease YdiL (CAAX protease family)